MKTSRRLRILFCMLVLAALGGEGYFVVSTHRQLSSLEHEVAAMKSTALTQDALYQKLASDATALEKRTVDIETVASKAIAGFKDNLAQAEKDRLKLETTLALQERARQLSDLSRQADNLKASAELAALQKQLTTSISTNDLSKLIDTWRPRIAKVTCRLPGGTSTGSGTIMRFSDPTGVGIGVLTNRHVIYGGTKMTTAPTSCDVSLPGSGATATAFRSKAQIQVDVDSDLDFGRLMLDNPPAAFANVAETLSVGCRVTPKLGETLVILGYPSIGSTSDITATDGIISGLDSNYYITSAKVERGNSGGAAVLVSGNCLLGVPTFVVTGGIESLARILDIRSIKN